MQSLSNKHHDQTTDDSYPASCGGRLSLWLPTKQSRLSLPNGVVTDPEMKTEYNFHVKLSESQYQEQDSSSTLSTRQSNLEAAKSNFHAQNVSFQSESQDTVVSSQPYKLYIRKKHFKCLFETRKKREEDYVRPSLPNGTAYYIGHQVQMEHRNQSLDCISYPFSGSCFGRITSAYDPNAVQYLHESRHLHALKRARGSGERFLNTKNLQESKPSTQMFDRNLVFQKISTTNASNSWGASTPLRLRCLVHFQQRRHFSAA